MEEAGGGALALPFVPPPFPGFRLPGDWDLPLPPPLGGGVPERFLMDERALLPRELWEPRPREPLLPRPRPRPRDPELDRF